MAQTFGYEIDAEGMVEFSTGAGVNVGVFTKLGDGFEIDAEGMVDYSTGAGVNVGVFTKLGDGFEIDAALLTDFASPNKPIADWTVYQAGSPGVTFGVIGIIWDPIDDSVEIIIDAINVFRYRIIKDPNGVLKTLEDCEFTPDLYFYYMEFE